MVRAPERGRRAVNNTYNVKTDGFFGELLCPAEDKYPGKALICFSGSDGNFDLTRTLAGVFRARGLTTLALAYVGQEADSLTLVVDENGNRVCGNTDLYENLQNNKNYTNIISANEKSLKIRFAGKRVVISVLKSDINGWIYLRVHNYLDFYREIVISEKLSCRAGL